MKRTEVESSDSKNQTPPGNVLTRKHVLKILGDCIRGLQKKGISGRFKDLELEKARDAKMRLMNYACSIYLSGLKDNELEQIERRIDQLEAELS